MNGGVPSVGTPRVDDTWLLLCAGSRTFLGAESVDEEDDPKSTEIVLAPCYELMSVRVQQGAQTLDMIQAHPCHRLTTPHAPVHFADYTAVTYVVDLDEVDRKMLDTFITMADEQRKRTRAMLAGVALA